MKERLFKRTVFFFVSSKLINELKALCDEDLLRQMMFYIVSNIINHQIIKVTQIGPDMHQKEPTLEQIKKNLKILRFLVIHHIRLSGS